jgi:hypothetical protein
VSAIEPGTARDVIEARCAACGDLADGGDGVCPTCRAGARRERETAARRAATAGLEWTRVEDDHPRWVLPARRHPSGALSAAGYLCTDEAIRTYGRRRVETVILAGLPPLPEQAWDVDR